MMPTLSVDDPILASRPPWGNLRKVEGPVGERFGKCGYRLAGRVRGQPITVPSTKQAREEQERRDDRAGRAAAVEWQRSVPRRQTTVGIALGHFGDAQVYATGGGVCDLGNILAERPRELLTGFRRGIAHNAHIAKRAGLNPIPFGEKSTVQNANHDMGAAFAKQGSRV